MATTIDFQEIQTKLMNEYYTKLIEKMQEEKKQKNSNTLYDNEIVYINNLIKKNNNSDIVAENNINKIIYNKQWKYLTREQKITKLDEFIDKNYTDPIKNGECKKFVRDNIDNKRMNTKKAVIYNIEKCIVTGIPILS